MAVAVAFLRGRIQVSYIEKNLVSALSMSTQLFKLSVASQVTLPRDSNDLPNLMSIFVL